MNPESSIFDVNWTIFDENHRAILSRRYNEFLEANGKSTKAQAIHKTDIRISLVMMCLSIMMTFANFENRKILLAIISLQFVFSFLSKVAESDAADKLKKSKEDFLSVLKSAIESSV